MGVGRTASEDCEENGREREEDALRKGFKAAAAVELTRDKNFIEGPRDRVGTRRSNATR